MRYDRCDHSGWKTTFPSLGMFWWKLGRTRGKLGLGGGGQGHPPTISDGALPVGPGVLGTNLLWRPSTHWKTGKHLF